MQSMQFFNCVQKDRSKVLGAVPACSVPEMCQGAFYF